LKGAELNYHTTEKELLSIIHSLQKFRIYLLGHKFTIITDNKALTFIHKCYRGNARITRWLLSIQEYDFDIIHCKGRENVVADTLSWNPSDSTIQDHSTFHQELEINSLKLKISKEASSCIKNIGKFQTEDNKLNNIIKRLIDGEHDKLKNKYQYHDGVLYREVKGSWRIYVPTQLLKLLITEFHNVYGHGGMQKTGRMFKEYFTGDKMNKVLQHVTSTCDLCQRCKDHFR
jgi:mRNA-degrading endonuclease YafQ of YafQ-DinJ toxin-antitoxin module